MWVSPDRGILVYTPILLVLLPALLRSWRQLPTWTTSLLLAGLAYTIVQAALISFTGGAPIHGLPLRAGVPCLRRRRRSPRPLRG